MIQLAFDKKTVVHLIVSLIVVLILDAIWLGAVSRKLKIYPTFNDAKPGYGLMAWGSLAFAHSVIITDTIEEGFAAGCMIGFVSYGVFNGTELALRDDWRKHPLTSICDWCWGTLMNGGVGALIAYLRLKVIK